MQLPLTWRWLAVAVAAVALVAAVVVLQMKPSSSLGSLLPHPGSHTSSKSAGEEDMSTHTDRYVLHANDATFEKVVLQSPVPVLVDFYADWCGPCQRLAPILEQLAAENPETKVVKVNVDHSPRVADEYGVDGIPNLKVFKHGNVTGELVGLASKSQLEQLLQR